MILFQHLTGGVYDEHGEYFVKVATFVEETFASATSQDLTAYDMRRDRYQHEELSSPIREINCEDSKEEETIMLSMKKPVYHNEPKVFMCLNYLHHPGLAEVRY